LGEYYERRKRKRGNIYEKRKERGKKKRKWEVRG
jgi:hypothetical protein